MSHHVKHGKPDHPVHELITERWSPYGYSGRPVSDEDLRSLFEAARWAASSYNEQPWRYIVARNENRAEFDQALSCLVEGNQGWAKNASVLVLAAVSLNFKLDGRANKAAIHDLGLAAGNLCFEATARGIHVHQMIGIVPEKVRTLYKVPEDYEPYTAIAIGYAADPEELDDKTKERDTTPRTRNPLSEFVFSGDWAKPAPWLG